MRTIRHHDGDDLTPEQEAENRLYWELVDSEVVTFPNGSRYADKIWLRHEPNRMHHTGYGGVLSNEPYPLFEHVVAGRAGEEPLRYWLLSDGTRVRYGPTLTQGVQLQWFNPARAEGLLGAGRWCIVTLKIVGRGEGVDAAPYFYNRDVIGSITLSDALAI